MTLSQKLREEVCKKLKIKPRQLHNRVTEVAIDAGITDRDVALLLLAHRQKIDVTKPRFSVRKDKLSKFEDELRAQKASSQPSAPPSLPSRRKGTKTVLVRTRRLLKFNGKYPEIFYDRLENEINTAYNNPELPNAVLILSRKLVENLVYNLLEYKFGGKEIGLYYDTRNGRAHDFGVLLENLKNRKSDFDQDLQEPIEKFLEKVHPFRRDANSKAHKVMEYLEFMREIDKLKIPEMTQILLKLIERVR